MLPHAALSLSSMGKMLICACGGCSGSDALGGPFGTLLCTARGTLSRLIGGPLAGTQPGFGPVLGRFWADLGPVFGRFWADLGPVLVGFWPMLGRFLAGKALKFGGRFLRLARLRVRPNSGPEDRFWPRNTFLLFCSGGSWLGGPLPGTQLFEKFFSKHDFGGSRWEEAVWTPPKRVLRTNFSKSWVPARGPPS